MAYDRIQALIKADEATNIHLTPRERECLLWLSMGLRNAQIAYRLGIKLVTVEFHLANARRKLNATTREQAVAAAVRMGLIEP